MGCGHSGETIVHIDAPRDAAERAGDARPSTTYLRHARPTKRRGRVDKRRLVGSLMGALLVAGLAAPGVSLAAAPEFERITVDETFVDDFLTEECGVHVMTTVSGDVILRTY